MHTRVSRLTHAAETAVLLEICLSDTGVSVPPTDMAAEMSEKGLFPLWL